MARRASLRLFIAMLLLTLLLPDFRIASAVSARQQSDQTRSEWSLDPGCFVYYENNGEALCRPATEQEAQALSAGKEEGNLRIIPRKDEGLFLQANEINIILRGTPQLDNFPQARDAFLRAAANWSALIRAPITVVIDVDFGPTRFGAPFPPGVLGSAISQQLGRNDFYREVRNALLASAESAAELALYNALPAETVPTDIGNTSLVFAPSSVLRALRLIAAIADPDGERGQFGPPPSIGFNSAFAFDFDPRDGVTPGQLDFQAVAEHEVGHVLGFTSQVGERELNPQGDIAVSIWDIFRFRRGEAAAISPASFTSAPRILSSGGEQVFFAGGEELGLSTGRPDSTGGDGFQASHWKNNNLTGVTLGVMDPDLAPGERQTIGDNDLKVLDAIGYGAEGADAGGPRLKKVTFNGSRLTIKGSDLARDVQLVVNFVQVAPPLAIKGNSKKLKINGSQADLNLLSGANLVQVIRNGLRSNIVVISL
ncbi:MAG: NF038122 family metalloprotease [Acidobacteriota bacterium]